MIQRLTTDVTFRLDSDENPDWGWDVNVGNIPVIYHMDRDQTGVGAFAAGLVEQIAQHASLEDDFDLLCLMDDPELRLFDAEVAADEPFPL